jgi:SAM-dependent methyltransferase
LEEAMKIVREYSSYEDYIDHQKEKSLDSKRVKKWLNEEWDQKIRMFTKIFKKNKEFLTDGGKALGICARTGQEIVALENLGMDAIGVDIAPHPPLVIQGDAHDLPFEDNEFDFVFSNSFDHSIYPDKFLSEMQRVLKPNGYGLLHLQLTKTVDDYAENIIVNSSSVKDLLDNSTVVKEEKLRRSCYNREIVFKKNEL